MSRLLPESDQPTRAGRRKARRQRLARLREEGAWYPKWYWPSFAVPGTAILFLLFALPFYVIFAITFGAVDIFQAAVPVWEPWWWDAAEFNTMVGRIFGQGEPSYAPVFIRTIIFVATASIGCILIGYPVAYYVARFGGKRKAVYLMLLIAPFWVSYLMRMLAWGNLLQNDGYVNQILTKLHILSEPYRWLDGKPITIISGLIYGYVPYMILPLYAGLDRISDSMLEASRDLGARPAGTFARVTLPLSRPSILAGLVIVSLPMFGDYYTNNLLAPGTGAMNMIGNLIDEGLENNRPGRAAALVLVLVVMLLIPMLYYLRTTRNETART